MLSVYYDVQRYIFYLNKAHNNCFYYYKYFNALIPTLR